MCQLPHLLFLETTPQHFNSESGYFVSSNSKQKFENLSLATNTHGLLCDRIFNFTVAKQLDWRNNIARQLLDDTSTSHKLNVTIVSLCKVLLSQWDSHPDRFMHVKKVEDDFMYMRDCSHWCTASGVLRFVIRQLYNSLIQLRLVLVDESNVRMSMKLSMRFAMLVRCHVDKHYVYLIHQMKKYRLDNTTFDSLGYGWNDVKWSHSNYFMFIPTGEEHELTKLKEWLL